MRAVFWEAEVDSRERLGSCRRGNIMSTGLKVEGKEAALSRAAARPLLPLSPPGAHQLLAVKAYGRAADRALETPTQPGSVLGCGPLHWDHT